MEPRAAIVVIVGSRPEAIKLAPVIRSLNEMPGMFRPIVCSTGQQRDLIVPALSEFGITPDIDLDVMRGDASLAGLTARLLPALDSVLEAADPAWVVVQGDTTSAMAGALAAFYRRIPVAHVEAGLRTDDRFAPFPEEVNRRIITQCADVHFAPTEHCRERLLGEGVPCASVVVTGNTVVDALLWTRQRLSGAVSTLPAAIGDRIAGRRLILVTLHRRENWGEPMARICGALRAIVAELPDVAVALPVHPNPRVRDLVTEQLDGHPRICLMPPQSYTSVVELMDRAFLILTDSGGLQEEAPTFGTPVLVLRDCTERPEGVAAGVARLVGTDPETIVAEVLRLALTPSAYACMSSVRSPYGDGRSSARIRAVLSQPRTRRRYEPAATATSPELPAHGVAS